MTTHLFFSLRRAALVVAATWGSCMATGAMAAPQAMDNSELADVVGGDGVSIIADINLNISRVSRSFNDGGAPTYAVLDEVGGGMFLGGVTVDVRDMPGATGETYIDIGMPGAVIFSKFGFKSSAVQTDQQAPIAPNQNLGGVHLNGIGAMTGHFLMWAK